MGAKNRLTGLNSIFSNLLPGSAEARLSLRPPAFLNGPGRGPTGQGYAFCNTRQSMPGNATLITG